MPLTLTEQAGIDLTLNGGNVDISVDPSEISAGILAAVLTVDGAGSGLDADTLDGQHASAFQGAGDPVKVNTGSFVSPSLSFTDDTDTGLYLMPPNRIAVTTAGQPRWVFGTTTNQSLLPIQLPDGSNTSPSLTYSSDTNTGFYRNAEGVIAATANGTRVAAFGGALPFRIDQSGTLFEAWHSGNVDLTVDGTNGVCIRFPIGYQVCFQRFSLGARDSVGSGTDADPYRSGVVTWTFPQPFSANPRVINSPDCGSASAAVRALSGTLGSVTTTAASNVQVVAIASASGSDTVFANVVAFGPWS